jgi:hypothetical protein
MKRPAIKQYRAKGQTMFFLYIQKASRTVAMPTANEEKIPTAQYERGMVVGAFFKLSTPTPPRIVGRLKRKENLAPSIHVHPQNLAIAIVDPLRERPGSSATVWLNPMNITSRHFLTSLISNGGNNNIFDLRESSRELSIVNGSI